MDGGEPIDECVKWGVMQRGCVHCAVGAEGSRGDGPSNRVSRSLGNAISCNQHAEGEATSVSCCECSVLLFCKSQRRV